MTLSQLTQATINDSKLLTDLAGIFPWEETVGTVVFNSYIFILPINEPHLDTPGRNWANSSQLCHWAPPCIGPKNPFLKKELMEELIRFFKY